MDLCREMIEIASRIASTEEIPFGTSNLHLILYLTGRELAISCSSNTVSIFIMSNWVAIKEIYSFEMRSRTDLAAIAENIRKIIRLEKIYDLVKTSIARANRIRTKT